VEAKILTPLHLESFRALCEAWERYRRMTTELAKMDSWTFATDKGYVMEVPEVRMRDSALQTLIRFWPKFGLTPEALARLGKHGGARRNKLTPLEEFAASKYE
jgi:P27 family predicted phage terminase small subunit